MTKYVSAYPGRLILPGGEEFSPGGEPVELGEELLENAAVREWIGAEWIVMAEDDGDDGNQAEPITREAIGAMGKAALIELLEAHGTDVDKRKGEEALRELAIATVFVNL